MGVISGDFIRSVFSGDKKNCGIHENTCGNSFESLCTASVWKILRRRAKTALAGVNRIGDLVRDHSPQGVYGTGWVCSGGSAGLVMRLPGIPDLVPGSIVTSLVVCRISGFSPVPAATDSRQSALVFFSVPAKVIGRDFPGNN